MLLKEFYFRTDLHWWCSLSSLKSFAVDGTRNAERRAWNVECLMIFDYNVNDSSRPSQQLPLGERLAIRAGRLLSAACRQRKDKVKWFEMFDSWKWKSAWLNSSWIADNCQISHMGRQKFAIRLVDRTYIVYIYIYIWDIWMYVYLYVECTPTNVSLFRLANSFWVFCSLLLLVLLLLLLLCICDTARPSLALSFLCPAFRRKYENC